MATLPVGTYPALTFWQPWATLIIEGLKVWEFREGLKVWEFRGTDYESLAGRVLAVHAGSRAVVRGEVLSLIYKLERGNDLARSTGIDPAFTDQALHLLHRWAQTPKSMPLSCILGVVSVARPIRNADLAESLGVAPPQDLSSSNWGFSLSNPRQLKPPVPYKGALGIWTWRPPAGLHLSD